MRIRRQVLLSTAGLILAFWTSTASFGAPGAPGGAKAQPPKASTFQAVGAGAPHYVRRPSAEATLRASLDASLEIPVGLGEWWRLAYFNNAGAKAWNAPLPAEGPIDLAATYEGLGGGPVRWERLQRFGEGKSNRLGVKADPGEQVAALLLREITCDEPCEILCQLGTNDAMAVWLNGRQILSRPVRKGGWPATEIVLRLRRGVNRLLVKCCSQSNRVYLLSSMVQYGKHRARERILEQLAKDFPPKAVRSAVRAIEIERTWRGRDGLLGPRADYGAGVAKAMDLAKATLRFVSRLRPVLEETQDLDALRRRAATVDEADCQALYMDIRRLRRRILLSHPLLGFQRLLINKRPPPAYAHQSDQYLGRYSGAGDGLVVLDNWRDEPTEDVLLAGRVPTGSVLHPDLSFDARRVVFSFCDHTVKRREHRRFFLYEIEIDPPAAARRLRQLTGTDADPLQGAEGRQSVLIEDFDPCYLPDGGLAFVSTRNQGGVRCHHGGRYCPTYTLYRADGDGGNIRPLAFGEANEGDPSVLHDGRIVWTRWDYINRHDTLFQSLWTTRPDGTGVAHLYGNYSRSPNSIAEARTIPGSHKLVATATAHHSYTNGSIIVIDPRRGQDGPEPLTRITPEVGFPETDEGRPVGNFATPWPLSGELFLVAYSPDGWSRMMRHRENAYGIYLIDTLGGRELIYRDPDMSCFCPIPIQPRPVPPKPARSTCRMSTAARRRFRPEASGAFAWSASCPSPRRPCPRAAWRCSTRVRRSSAPCLWTPTARWPSAPQRAPRCYSSCWIPTAWP